MRETTINPLAIPMPEKGDKLFKPLNRQQGGIRVHPGGVTDSKGKRDLTTRRYIYEEGYKRGADLLLGATQYERTPDILLYPIVFLYRHYLELRLKSLLNGTPSEIGSESSVKVGHDLVQLWRDVKDSVLPLVRSECLPVYIDAVDSCIEEFVELDRGGDAFRYPEFKTGSRTLDNVDSINLSNLGEVMGKIANFLDCVDNAIEV